MKLVKQEVQAVPLPAIDGAAEELRDKLAMAAMSIKVITDNASNLAARNAAVAIRSHIRDVEAERQRLTKPLLAGQKMLIQLANDHLQPLQGELDRLERLAADYLQAEARRVERERADQDKRLAGLLQERLDLEHQATVAASSVTTEAELAKAIEAEQIAKEAAWAVQTAIAQPLARMDKARGQQLRTVLCWECTDIVALYKARPDLCKITPSAACILDSCVPEMPVPGLKLWWETRSTFSTR